HIHKKWEAMPEESHVGIKLSSLVLTDGIKRLAITCSRTALPGLFNWFVKAPFGQRLADIPHLSKHTRMTCYGTSSFNRVFPLAVFQTSLQVSLPYRPYQYCTYFWYINYTR
ncbi:hypothetical protein L9F63_004789, partial [Diploptera punctata]